jgi:5-methylcytosine-specific restriction endonuclease McrA
MRWYARRVRKCPVCGTEFEPKTERQKLCGDYRCRGRWAARNHKPRELHVRACSSCSGPMKTKSYAPTVYCDTCRLPLRECGVCGSEFRPRVRRQILCSRACTGKRAHLFQNQSTGREHPHWRGGHAGYRGPGWRVLSRQIRERDGWRCQDCGVNATGKYLQVHHRVAAEDWTQPGYANDPDNLISLCALCHQKRHKGTLDPEVVRLRRQDYYRRNRERILARVKEYQAQKRLTPQTPPQ